MAYKPKLPFTQSTTNDIVNNHRYDFNWKNFDSYMKSKGGYNKYVKSLGGVFAKWADRNTTAKVTYKATTVQEFQEAADYVVGIMTAWGFDYNNSRKNPHWGNLSDDAFYTKDFNFSKITGKDNGANCSIDEIASGKINKAGMCTNCGYGVTYIFRKAGLIPEGAEMMEVEFYGDKSWHKYYRNRGATLYKNLSSKEFKVGDVIGFYKDTGFASYNHCCVVVKVDKSAGTYTIFDTGSARFVKTRGCNVVTKIGTSPLYGSYKSYKVMRLPLNLKEVSTVLTMDQFYKKYNGKAIDHDGAYGVQCVDGFRLLCMELGIPVKPTPNNYADGYWIYRDSLGYSKYFDYVTDWKKLQNGDVVIWKRGSKSHPSSHIAMYYLGKEFGQNQGSNREFLLKSTDFTDILGALRPKQWVQEKVMANVLFIGNSYTYKPNDKDNLPQQFKAVCKANGVTVAVTMIAEGGWTLEQHWNNSATITAIKSKKYKYVVIQGQSDEVGCRNGKLSDKAKTYGVKLGNLARQYGAKVFFLSQSDYYYRTSDGKKTYFNMKYQDQVDANYRIIANACSAWVSCGGQKVKKTANGQYASYFASDGYHPTAKAQKLVAQALWGSMMSYLKPTPPKITYVHATGVASYYNKSKGGTYKVNAKDGLHIRNDGYQSAKSLAVLPYGTEFRTYGYYDKDSQGREWYYGVARKGNVEYTGFCCAKTYLKKV